LKETKNTKAPKMKVGRVWEVVEILMETKEIIYFDSFRIVNRKI